MESFTNNFLKKKILVYGLGKSGLSTLKFLQKKVKSTLMMILIIE